MSDALPLGGAIAVSGDKDCLHCAIWRAIADHAGDHVERVEVERTASALIAVLGDLAASAPTEAHRAHFCATFPSKLQAAIARSLALRDEHSEGAIH